ncbi:MAG: lamin tail domain-containing protein [Candidatus Cloacimonetes bacterium]|nr:lamin tail domain-containing protein [Candidatus Cloacimonadota bacterium]
MKKVFVVCLVLGVTGIFGDIIVSEMCDPLSDYRNDRFIEIYNSGTASVDLSGWSIVAVGNSSDIFTWNLSGNIVAGDALVCGDATTTDVFDVDFTDEGWSDSNSTWNGKVGDGAKLMDDNRSLVDYAVVDDTAFENKTYVRNPDIINPNTSYDINEWTGTPVDQSSDASPGSHTSGGDPVISKAFSSDYEVVNVYYNLSLETVNAADFVLTGSEEITFSTAVIDDDNDKLVYLSDPSTDINADYTVDMISDEANRSSYNFYAGMTPISFLNTAYPDGYLENDIYATFAVMLTANDGYNNIWVSDDTGPYHGVLVYDYDFVDIVGTDLGTALVFAATRDVYNTLTELKNPVLISLDFVDHFHEPTTISGSDIDINIAPDTNPGEKWEGQLCRIGSVVVSAATRDDLYYGSDDGGTTMFAIGDNVDYLYSVTAPILDAAVASGDPIELIGVVDYYNDHYRINPRFSEDCSADEEVIHQPDFTLNNNLPNPFHNSTEIHFQLPLKSNIELAIYNLKGQKINTLINSEVGKGDHFITWNGKDMNNKTVASGVYYYRLDSGNYSSSRKMILLR